IAATERVGCGGALLACHGPALAVPAVAALGEAVNDSTFRRHREPSGFDPGRARARPVGRTGVLDSYKKAGDVAFHYRRHHDFCRMPGGLWILAQRVSGLAEAVPQHY